MNGTLRVLQYARQTIHTVFEGKCLWHSISAAMSLQLYDFKVKVDWCEDAWLQGSIAIDVAHFKQLFEMISQLVYRYLYPIKGLLLAWHSCLSTI